MKVMIAMLGAASGLLTACSATVQDRPALHETPALQNSPTSQLCRPEAAVALVGHATPDDMQLRQRTGAVLIRRIAPGDAVTQDFRDNRVTVAIDPAGKIVQASCG
jgi:hypothetical protein